MEIFLLFFTNISMLVTMSYIAIKGRYLVFVEKLEIMVVPTFTGFMVTVLLISGQIHGIVNSIDISFLPFLIVGLRYGWTYTLLSAIIPLLYTFSFMPGQIFLITHQILLPALISPMFHRKNIQSFSSISVISGIYIALVVVSIRFLNGMFLYKKSLFTWSVQNIWMLGVAILAIMIIIVMYNDDNKKWIMQRKLELEASQDGLTGLPNLKSFLRIAQDILGSSPISIMMVDLDYFKNYNDSHGHVMGDYLLQHISQVLRHNIGERDYIARYGGEEFIILCHSVNRQEMERIAVKLCQAVSTFPFSGLENQPHETITISIGISTAEEAGVPLHRLISEADTALYSSKNNGRNQYTFYSSIFGRTAKQA